jgi:hypothetical protein
MNRYAIYLAATGAILRVVQCPSSQALAQLSAGEALLPIGDAVISDSTHRVEAGQFAALPPAPPVSEPTETELRLRYSGYAQAHMDSYARSWGYDDIARAVSYVGDPYARFNAEGLALRNWRSAIWAYLDTASASPLPTPLPTKAEFLAMLPTPPNRPIT